MEPARPALFGPLFAGPELLYRVGRSFLGTPYHRDRQGILDTLAFFGAEDLEASRGLAEVRRAGFVVQCRNAPELLNLLATAPRDCLGRRLLVGAAPGWLEPVTLPAGLLRAVCRVPGRARALSLCRGLGRLADDEADRRVGRTAFAAHRE